MNWALVDGTGTVQSLIVYDGISNYTPPAGLYLEQVNAWVQIGQNINISEPAAPPAPTNGGAALAALTESDKTVLRCCENSVAVPTVWAQYRAALRALVDNPTTAALPDRPSYPAGT